MKTGKEIGIWYGWKAVSAIIVFAIVIAYIMYTHPISV